MKGNMGEAGLDVDGDEGSCQCKWHAPFSCVVPLQHELAFCLWTASMAPLARRMRYT